MKKFAVIGHPIAHSLSPIIHNLLFAKLGIKASYEKLDLEASELKWGLKALDGANITLPYKESVFKLCDEVCGVAQELGAVNTILRSQEGLKGYNTDASGFWECIKFDPPKKALILGAGGTARAVCLMMQAQGVEVFIHNRKFDRLDFFLSRGVKLAEREETYDLLVHTTSSGVGGENLPDYGELLDVFLLQSQKIFDVIYPSNKMIKDIDDLASFFSHRPLTPLLNYACKLKGLNKSEGLEDGLRMLLFQALLAFEIFCEGKYCFKELKALFYNACKRL